MNFCRRNAGVVAYGGLLYVIGGDDGSQNLSSVEVLVKILLSLGNKLKFVYIFKVYHPESDVWKIMPAAMNIGRSYAGCAIIDKQPI